MKIMMFTLLVSMTLTNAYAEETVTEKAGVVTNSAKRSVKKGYHRSKEAFCGKLTGDSRIECMAKRTANRMEEGKDAVQDKSTEIKNSVDTDKK